MEAVLEAPAETALDAPPAADLGGMFLTFHLDSEVYGVEILKVREIIGIMDITPVPQTQNFVEGVINLRGKVIPVMNLRSRFGLEPIPYDDQTCIIVVDVGVMMGIVVDTVQEVNDIPSDRIEEPPAIGMDEDSAFILGMGKVGDDVKLLLDIDQVLTAGNLVDCDLASLG